MADFAPPNPCHGIATISPRSPLAIAQAWRKSTESGMKLNVRSDYREIVFINPPPLRATISAPLEDKKGKEKTCRH
ncbi:hypothetical protein [Neorhizobium galegae]|uniref:hypothetical protein n=1 Tax=Neorhizobium galegae TaxID=399 RepID=UPI00155E4964|nr:hypothetical protein [Neorhizobium galegae]